LKAIPRDRLFLWIMLILISPAKTLDFESNMAIGPSQDPYFLPDAVKVNKSLRKKSRRALRELQGISQQLAELNYHRNQEWTADRTGGERQAVLAFKGDVYQGLNADSWEVQDVEFADEHLRILSGLYGLLRPTDLIKPYRLEMGTSLKVGRRENLYLFWADKLKSYFRENIEKDIHVVNLASNEYFKAIETAKIPNPVLEVTFKDFSNDDYKVVSFFAKKARGLMANFVIRNKLNKLEELKAFNEEGYYFAEAESTDHHYVFLRDKTN